MEVFKSNEKGYKIRILYDKDSLNLSINNIESKIEDKINYESIRIDFKKCFKKYFENFIDLIDKIKKKKYYLK